MRSIIHNFMKYSLLILVSVFISLITGELLIRYIDDFELTSFHLVKTSTFQAPNAEAMANERESSEEILTAARDRLTSPGVNSDWFWLSPPLPLPARASEETLRRLKEYPSDPYGAFYWWNKNYLKESLCKGRTLGSLGILDTFFTFDPRDNSIYPLFRHIPNMTYSVWFKANAFGFRGPALQLNKPDNVVRIAFVGASTTVNAFGVKYSYPEYVVHWLNIWARENSLQLKFEVINAGRAGVASPSIAAAFVNEVSPLEPDFTVYYEGSNQFYPISYLDFDSQLLSNKIVRYLKLRPFENYSATLRRLYIVWDRFNSKDGAEPYKGSYTVNWPQGLNEFEPDIDTDELPVQLNTILSDLDRIRAEVKRRGSTFVLSSFIWMVEDGMVLDPKKNIAIWRQLNETYWPIPYAHFRRMADFQNRVFHAYAQSRDIAFIDVATGFPMDPRLFNDAIHMNEDGLRLRAWVTFQKLLPIVQSRINSGELPRPDQEHLSKHPSISESPPALISRQKIMSQCGA